MSFARFKTGDCDATGIARYNLPKARWTHRNGEIVTAQEALIKAGFLKPGTADGNCGPATLRAIEQWETANDTDFYIAHFPTETEPAAVGDTVMIDGVQHVSQWDYPNIEIVPGKSVRKIGCLSSCCEVIHAYARHADPDIPRFVDGMKQIDGYSPGGDIQWDAVEALTNLTHARDIGIANGKESLAEGQPIILCIRTRKGSLHFIVAIGYDGQGFHCHDVGSWRGDGYAHPNRVPGPSDPPGQTFVAYRDVVRVDSLS